MVDMCGTYVVDRWETRRYKLVNGGIEEEKRLQKICILVYLSENKRYTIQ
jgi:hypothetical protein